MNESRLISILVSGLSLVLWPVSACLTGVALVAGYTCVTARVQLTMHPGGHYEWWDAGILLLYGPYIAVSLALACLLLLTERRLRRTVRERRAMRAEHGSATRRPAPVGRGVAGPASEPGSGKGTTPPVPPGVVTLQVGLVTGESFVGPSSLEGTGPANPTRAQRAAPARGNGASWVSGAGLAGGRTGLVV